MKKTGFLSIRGLICCGVVLVALFGCGGGGSSSSTTPGDDPVEPSFAAASFTQPTEIDNLYRPMIPGMVQIYQADTEDGIETIVVEVLDETREVAGVTSRVVRDRVFLEELLIEDTYDWFAQDDDGHIWYMGERVINYDYDDAGDLLGTDNDGAWEAGLDVADSGSLAEAGILIKAEPMVGDSYQQEFYEGEAEDMAEVTALDQSLTLADGSAYTGVVKIREWSPLEADSDEFKYYAPGVGLLREEAIEDDEVAELKGSFDASPDSLAAFSASNFTNPTVIDNPLLPLSPGTTLSYSVETEDGTETTLVEVLTETRTVAGVLCVVVRDRVSLDGVLIEDTRDWFAQDDAGNVWYMGEIVVNYEYDDEGNLEETNDHGSWEAGVDGALPGIQMWAAPVAGQSYYQEFYADEAEDMGLVVATGVEVSLSDGSTYADCLQTLDWNPLDPAILEYKFYAPGIGMIKEAVVGSDEDPVELVVD
jgi:hypothetical protein